MNSSRLLSLQSQIRQKKIAAFFVTSFYNILYLTGFKGVSPDEREGYLLVFPDKIYFFTDGRYQVQAQEHFDDKDVEVCIISPAKRLTQWLVEITNRHTISEIIFEKTDLRYSEYELLNKSIKLTGGEALVEQLRKIKDEEEVKLVKKACVLTNQCLNDVSKLLRKNVMEKEITWKLELMVREKGYDLAFDPIVAFGPNSALPHHSSKNSEAKLRQNNLILIDFGIKYKDYCSDITRMFYYGKSDEKLVNMYNNLLSIQKQAIDNISRHPEALAKGSNNDTASLKNIDLFVRQELNKKQLPPMLHSTGHGVGLQIHEGPSVSSISKDTLRTGQIFTIEPGVYIPGKYGMRIEDTVYINDQLTAIPLTNFPKNLVLISG